MSAFLAKSPACAGMRRQLKDYLAGLCTPELRQTALFVLLVTAVCSLAVHGFLFANEFFSHDSVLALEYDKSFTISAGVAGGRFLIPLYEELKGAVAAPWLIGLLFILWTSLASFFTVRLLQIRSRAAVALTCCLYCSNAALILTGASYVFCLDEYALALCAAAAAAWMFERDWYGALPGVVLLVISLSFYQSYFTVTLGLCFLCALKRTLEAQPVKRIIARGIRSLAMMAAGFVAYYVIWSVLCSIMGVERGRMGETLLGVNGLTHLWELLKRANTWYFDYFLLDNTSVLGVLLPALHTALLLLLACKLFLVLLDRGFPAGNKCLLLLGVLLLPTALNSVTILLYGSAHGLTLFAQELIYILVLLWGELPAFRRDTFYRAAAVVLLCCVLWQHMVYANQVYMKKNLEKTETVSLATRILDRMEQMEGYVPGETPVAFVGNLDGNPYVKQRDGFQSLYLDVGLWHAHSAPRLNAYLANYMNVPLAYSYSDYSQLEAVQAMPLFPLAGSVQMVDGVVIVKFS